ncbi:hypothetical protein MOKP125_51000 [Mycobacterium avium subsp. hominissuis]
MSAELSQSPSVAPLSAADIDDAAKRIAAVVTPTPLQFSDRLSAITGAQVYLKREDLQIVRSYKLRGAYNLLVQLSETELAASTCRPRRRCRSGTGSATTAGSSSS